MRIRLPRREKNKAKTYKQTVVNAVILVVILSLFLYIAIQLSHNFSAQVSTQRTQKFTDVTHSYLEGCIFKDGEVLSSDGDIVHYLVPNGAKVGVGQAYAEIFSGTAIPEGERAATEQRLNELSERIGMLEIGLEGGKNTSDLGSINDDISDNYYAYIDSILSGDIGSADRSGEKLLGALIDYSAVTLSEAAKNTLSALKEERAALLEKIGGRKTTLVSDRSFTFYRDADGYESSLNSSLVTDLNYDTLSSLMKKDQSSVAGGIGSMIYSAKWYIALPTDEAEYERFKDGVGRVYEVGFIGSEDLTVEMKLEGAFWEEEEPESAYLLFSSFDLARIAGLDRHQSVRITLDSVTGYRIPREAVHTLGEDQGVYILVGNMIEFRRITIIGEGDGYYVVNTYERDLEESLGSEIPYLNVNDLIVTSGRDLYDGKLLD